MNKLNQDLTGKTVIAHGERFVCESGFGCKAETSGQKIYGYWPDKTVNAELFEDGKVHGFISGLDVEALA